MSRITFEAALVVLALAACNDAPAPVLNHENRPRGGLAFIEVDAAVTLPKGIYALSALDDALDDAALDPLRGMVAPAEIVGLGESTRGSGGFARGRTRISKFLITQSGFRVVAFQINRADMAAAARFVATCEAPTALPGEDGAKASELLAWMCSWNRANPSDRVSIVGIGTDQPQADEDTLRLLVAKAAGDDSANLVANLSQCAEPAFSLSLQGCRDALADIEMYLVRQATSVSERTTDAERAQLHLALTSFRGGRAASFYAATDPGRSMEARGETMAALLRAEIASPYGPSKVIVWADGSDLTAQRSKVTDSWLPGTTTMGTALGLNLGHRYMAIDLIAWDVETPVRIGFVRAAKPSAASVELRLHDLRQPYLLVDLEAEGVMSFLGENHFEVGAPNKETLIPHEQFRALVFLDTAR